MKPFEQQIWTKTEGQDYNTGPVKGWVPLGGGRVNGGHKGG
jgi:hypothetical protein